MERGQSLGEAFGPGPPAGRCPARWLSAGFWGAGWSTRSSRGDGSTGTLTSPPFRIERPYLNFLIGGGRFPGKTCVDLVIDGKVVRTATGPNDKPGGTEQLDWAAWDVHELRARPRSCGSSTTRPAAGGISTSTRSSRAIAARASPPARPRAGRRPSGTCTCRSGKKPRCGGCALRPAGGSSASLTSSSPMAQPDFQVFLDLQAVSGADARHSRPSCRPSSKALEQITLRRTVPDAGRLYHEPRRPQFHFTSRRGMAERPQRLALVRG